MSHTLRLIRGDKRNPTEVINLAEGTSTSNVFLRVGGFAPRAGVEQVQWSGRTARRDGQVPLASSRDNAELSITYDLHGGGAVELQNVQNRVGRFLHQAFAYETERIGDPIWLEYRWSDGLNDLPAPVFGQMSYYFRVLWGEVPGWPKQLHSGALTAGNIESVVCNLICEPTADGLEQVAGAGGGGLLVGDLGLTVAEPTTNYIKDPQFGNDTLSTYWTAGTVTDVPWTEYAALVALYTATTGASWTTKTNWLTSTTVGNWYGVTVSGGHVTRLDLNTNNLVGTVTLASLMDGLPSLTYLRMNVNASLIVTGTLSDLHAGMQYLYLYSTGSTITGALATLPASMIFLSLGTSNCVITGALSDMPASMQSLYVYQTSSVITGTAGDPAPDAVGFRKAYLQDTGMSAAACDDILQYIWEQRATWTYATPEVNVGGTNTNPNGVYQAANPPTTGLEYAYELVNDSNAEGYIKWAVTY